MDTTIQVEKEIKTEEISKPKRKFGGAQPGAGRPKGRTNYSTREIRELAQEYGPAAIRKLAKLMRYGKTEQTQAAAAKELLVRGYGNSLTISGPNDGPIPVSYEGLSSTLHGMMAEILGPEAMETALKSEQSIQ